MGTFNSIFTALFNVLLAPFGHAVPWFDLILWPILGGILALLVIRAVSNQTGIVRAKRLIQVNLLEIVLFRDDLRVVLPATGKALGHNLAYLAYNLVPMLVMFVPMTAVLVQLVSHYAYAPLAVDDTAVLMVQLDSQVGQVSPKDVTLELPPGVRLDAPPVRTADGEVVWRLRLDEPGDHVLKIQAGGVVEEKTLAVGGEPRKVSVLRTKSWEALLYPTEAVPAASSPVASIAILDRHEQPLRGLPDGEGGVLGWFFALSLVSGFLLKGYFGVTL